MLSAQTLAQYDLDLPFTLFYALEPHTDQARLIGSTGLEKNTVARLNTVYFGEDEKTAWPLAEIVRLGSAVQITTSGSGSTRLPSAPTPKH